MPPKLHAVLVADVISSRSRPGLRRLLGVRLAAASRRHLRRGWIKLAYSITAGDEFQTVARHPACIPAMLLDLRATFRPLSLHIGVGFGSIAGRIQSPVNRLGGSAFQSARQAIEAVKKRSLFKFDVLTAFASPDMDFDRTVNLIYSLHDTLVLRITEKQWKAIAQFLETPTLERGARHLGLDVSTVSRTLKRGYYWQIYETSRITGALIQKMF